MTSISLPQMFAVIFMGVFAQLYMRIFVLDGSLDKPWLLLFGIPPLSIVPALMMYFGAVAPGQGGKPYDMYMWLPTGLTFLAPIVTNMLDNYDVSDIIQTIIETIIPLLGGIFAFFLRDYNNCNEKLKDKPKQTNNLFYKSFSNAVIAYSVASFIETAASFIPIVGQIFSVISMIPIIGPIMSGLFYVIVYIVINMYNNMDAYDYCLGDGFSMSRNFLTSVSVMIFMFILLKDIIADKLGFGFLL
jgi:hypothetical protein